MKIGLVAIGVGIALFLSALAVASWRGRDSRPWHLMSSVLSPLLPTPTLDRATRLPLESDLSDGVPDGVWFAPELVDVSTPGDGLVLETTRESVWFHNERGAMVWLPVEGDLDVSVVVRVRKASDPDAGLDAGWQFAGLMLRDVAGDQSLGRESYVFNVVGFRPDDFVIESKSTRLGRSAVDAYEWPSGDAEVRILRRANTFTLFARPIAGDAWTRVNEYVRTDLPVRLQLGLIAYSFDWGSGRYDMRATFEALKVTDRSDD